MDSSATAGTGGKAAFPDIPCKKATGCIEGDAQLALHCKGPDNGTGVTSWDASFSAQTPTLGGACVYHAAAAELSLSFSDVDLVWPFKGGGSAHLGNNSNLARSFSVDGHGAQADPAGLTVVNTSVPCSKGCEIDVLPEGRPLGAPGEWVTYRFVVTCHEPLGIDDTSACVRCTMDPQSFTVDAACYFPPAGA